VCVCVLCLDEEKHDIYEFLDPKLIHPMGNKRAEIETYITYNLMKGRK